VKRPTIVFVDFDGTVAAEIASNRLLDRFAVADWRALDRRFDSGELSFRDRVVKGFSLLSGSREMMQTFARTLSLRPGFPEFVRTCRGRGYPIIVVSEALDVMIHAMLDEESFNLPVYCNRAVFHPDGRYSGIELPYIRRDCPCEMGVCKRAIVLEHAQPFERVVYIGDGSNDFCPAREAHMIFARRRLAEHCRTQDIAYIPFEDFFDVQAALDGEP
jgi:2,3-diketo-5-methylthio-1-phosphopentane phosphatase